MENQRPRLTPAKRREKRHQAMLRYEKQKRRNVMAVPGCHDIVLVLDHLKGGFNVPKIFRSAEAFGAAEVHLVNVPPFDPAPGKGAFKKVPARFFEQMSDSLNSLREAGYSLFALSADADTSLTQSVLPEKSAFILGHEEFGHSFDPAQQPDINFISIPQFGQVESLNVSVAASIVLYEYVRQHEKK
ncbi:TrmH family RNA methyltransferase [Solemya velum gill symbiont]|uniref:tRNA (Guanine-N2)-dimethyltransferase n=1 Tax=Solemya velum gill symbiont TaxID=2340 RepID=A0A1T2CKE2_SOVGS|nr:TrmH family RNA methyltransferase [Solemya velum gill symbiont]OOY35262.1 tRNA (guanine-N2)-dimethyltransferase [Solemya velum gill symbiont]OOY37963.1 tRNA (guanine-N2)-dimethyltransferase [Solemya velum gill symbiont]OOY41559.1 tRNA (guanine-N2)-dimethyltransferase [Solemya velum gill symbiont]OOY44991.1 tRNA (guanine-N2)-dimethyltransferase [Solemya velum gill symbiont]OOY48233.1 tRNA (guanine-N2)-dimethyltransferase [Solemya velum gill symbiont]